MKAILVIDIEDCVDITKYGANIYLTEKQDYYPCRRFVEEYLDVSLKPMPKYDDYRADTSFDQMKIYHTGYADGWNDCLKEIGG